MTRIAILLAVAVLGSGCIAEVAMCDDDELAAAEAAAVEAEAQGATPGHNYVDTLDADGNIVRPFRYDNCIPASLGDSSLDGEAEVGQADQELRGPITSDRKELYDWVN